MEVDEFILVGTCVREQREEGWGQDGARRWVLNETRLPGLESKRVKGSSKSRSFVFLSSFLLDLVRSQPIVRRSCEGNHTTRPRDEESEADGSEREDERTSSSLPHQSSVRYETEEQGANLSQKKENHNL